MGSRFLKVLSALYSISIAMAWMTIAVFGCVASPLTSENAPWPLIIYALTMLFLDMISYVVFNRTFSDRIINGSA